MRRVARLLCCLAGLGFALAWCGARLQGMLRAQLPVWLKQRLEAALGRPVAFGELRLLPTGLRLEGFRVPRRGTEPRDPLTTEGLRVHLDWWSLLWRRQVRVDGVDLDRARLALGGERGGGPGEPWTRQILRLAAAGIERFGLRDAAITFTAGGAPVWQAEGIDGEFRFRPGAASYAGRLARLQAGSAALERVSLRGLVQPLGVELQHAGAVYRGGLLGVRGRLDTARDSARLRVRGRRIPLARLAAEIGIPLEWTQGGSVSGEVELDAAHGRLRSVRGELELERPQAAAREAGERLWTAARARVHWTPDATWLRAVQVRGDGLLLTGEADVETTGGAPFVRGRFRANGRLVASRPASVEQVAELLAFRRVLGGRWHADALSIDFRADGPVADLAQARATGEARVDALRFQPTPGSKALTVARADAELERLPGRLYLRRIRAQTDGLAFVGEATIRDDRQGAPGAFTVAGRVEVRDGELLRRALPGDAFRRWVPVLSDSAGGRVRFRAEGPTADPVAAKVEGEFTAGGFRLAARSPLPNRATLFIPIREARGRFHRERHRLTLTDLRLLAPSFEASGAASLHADGSDPQVSAHLHLATADWRHLPTMPPDALPELEGGRFEADLTVEGPVSALAELPVRGSFRLTDAQFAPAGEPPVPVERLEARFVYAARTLELRDVSLSAAMGTVEGTGRIFPVDGEYRLALDLFLRAPDGGLALRRLLRDALRMDGGALEANLRLEAPVRRFAEATLSGDLRLEHPALVLDADRSRDGASGETEAPLPALRSLSPLAAEARSLQAAFTVTGGEWRLSRLRLEADGWEAALDGALGARRVDADVRLASRLPFRARGVSLEGGALAVEGRLQGDPSRPESLTLAGRVSVEGATLRADRGRLPVTRGRLDLTASGEGSLADPLRWLRSGTLALADAEARLPDGASRRLERLTAAFARDGESIRWQDALLTAADGLTVRSRGAWTPAGYEASLTLEAPHATAIGIRLPAGWRVGATRVTATLAGTPQHPLTRARGLVEATAVSPPPVATSAAREADIALPTFERVTASFDYAGDRLRIEDLRARAPALSLVARGEVFRGGWRGTVSADGNASAAAGQGAPGTVAAIVSRLFPAVSAGEYRLEASLTASGRSVAARGRIRLADLRFPLRLGAEAADGRSDAGASTPEVRLDEATSRFELADGRLLLRDLRAVGPAGSFAGEGEVRRDGYRLSLAAPAANPDLFRALLPGEVSGGRLSGSVTLEGGPNEPVRVAAGRFDLRDAIYRLPADLGLSREPARVARFAGAFRRAGDRTELTDLTLASDRLDGAGALSLRGDGTGVLRADLATRDLGRVADYWPALAGKLAGGEATGRLELNFGPTAEGGAEARGTLTLADRGGVLRLPVPAPEFAEHPVESATALLRFEPGRLVLSDVRIRGPKGNLDGDGVWVFDGPVSGRGKAWLASGYTASLIRPTGWGWLAKLVGIRRLSSDFELSGSSRRVMLRAAITRSLLWKFVRGRVPESFRQIAQGKAPLWEEPVQVAESGPAAAPANP